MAFAVLQVISSRNCVVKTEIVFFGIWKNIARKSKTWVREGQRKKTAKERSVTTKQNRTAYHCGRIDFRVNTFFLFWAISIVIIVIIILFPTNRLMNQNEINSEYERNKDKGRKSKLISPNKREKYLDEIALFPATPNRF